MAKLSQMNLPIKNESTGVVTDQTFDIGTIYTAGYGVDITNDVISSKTFTGTTAQWDALSSAQQATYTFVCLTDDSSSAATLNALDDVAIISPTDGQALIYDDTNNEWVNGQIDLSGKISEPSSEGIAGQVLTTDGNGGRYWTTVSGGTDILIGDVSGAAGVQSTDSAVLTWSDPDDIVIGGIVFAAWAGTTVVRKIGSAPSSVSDGTIVVTNTTKNQYSSTGYIDTGLTYGTTYYYRFFPYKMSGSTKSYTAGSSVNVTIARTVISTIPNQSGSLTYDGTEQAPTWSNYDSSKLTIGGDTEGTNAGTYTATFTPKTAYEWSDGTTAAKSVSWSIAKATGGATFTHGDASFDPSSDTIVLDSETLTDTLVIASSTGTISSVTSSDTSTVTASLSGSTITFSNVNETTGSVTVTVSVAASTNYEAEDVEITVEAQFAQIYGAEWDGTSSSAWSRTDAAELFTDPSPAVNNGNGSSPFDNVSPWKDIKRVTSDTTAGVLVEIPKYYYKWTRSGSKMKLQISSAEFDGALVSPAHADRGDGKGERDVVYVGAYHCANSTYKSTTGVQPANNLTRAEFRANIHNLGSTYWQWDFAMWWTIMMLYLVEYANWNSQAQIGYGCGNNSEAENAGLTDSMTYHTGTNAASRTTYGHTRYRYIEDLWGNVYDWVDGIYFSGTTVYTIKNPANFSDTSSGTYVGTRASTSGVATAWTSPNTSGFEYALYPSATTNDSKYSTYDCDVCDYDTSGVVLRVGGCYYKNLNNGAFFLGGNGGTSVKFAYIGSRLQKLP